MIEEEKKSTGDYALAVARAGLSSIPLVGVAATELLGLIVTPPLEKRKEKLMEEIGERLKKLEEQGLNLDELSSNEKFVTIILTAVTDALRTSEKEKIEAFKNAIANTAMGNGPDEATSSMFLNLVDRFTIWHIRILRLFSDPPKWYKSQNRNLPQSEGSLSIILDDAYPELKLRTQFVNVVWSDLRSAGLMSRDLGGMISYRSMLQPSTSEWGNQFLKFISES